MGRIAENTIEHAALGWLQSHGYAVCKGADISPGSDSPLRQSYEDVVLEPRLHTALREINPHLPEDAIEQAVREVTRPPHPTLPQNNHWFHRLLIDGVDVEYRTNDGETRGDRARLVDFDNPSENDLMAVSQFTVKCGEKTRRADLVVFLNGLPVAVFELKDPTDEETDVWKAYKQLQSYKEQIPVLFTYNELMVISDGDNTRAGTITSGPDWFTPWCSIEDYKNPGRPVLETMVKELFTPETLTEYLRRCIILETAERGGNIAKKAAGYHQFRAVRNALGSVQKALKEPVGDGDGRGGVLWHTQGAGKSLTMLMLAGALIGDARLKNPTIVVVTDRNDLDGQLFDTFASGWELLRQHPQQAQSRKHLVELLDRSSGGVVFTTIQKFEERGGAVSDRSNIVVMADEAHRSQYGFLDGGARWMRDMIPNATFVGFTGTPLELDDRNTPAVFGKYADIYDIGRAIEDNATVPIYYDMRLVSLHPDENGIREAEVELEEAFKSSRNGRELSNYFEIALEELVGARQRLKMAAREIVEHFEKRRGVIEGKAMAVCMSRNICMDLYDEITALRPGWHADEDEKGAVKVVMTGSAEEGERVAGHARTKARREAIARRFKDPDDELRLVIVCDMWLTGFDCPPLHTMYLDKPLAGHSLMQAIARVNRVFGDKPGGVVVDFLGIADQLRDAVQSYTQAGGEGSPVHKIQQEAVPIMQREFEKLRDFFDGFDYSAFFDGSEERQMQAISAGADYVFEQKDGKKRFMSMVTSLSKAFSLSVPLPETEDVRDHLAYFQSVRAAIRKRLADDGPGPPPDSRAAVRQVISGAIASEGVIDLFQAAGLPSLNVGILSEEFLEKLAAMPHKNLALETLRKLLNDQIRSRERVNIVQSQSFRKSLDQALTRYNNRAVTTAQIIEELIGLAKTIREAVDREEESDLTKEEIAFYDALADNESAREVMQDDKLKLIARKLSDRIKRKASLDWTQRETVRADMRRSVRRLLARHGYPPDAQEAATQLVIKQAELMAEETVK